MSGTSKKHVFHVKWKMFPHVPPACSQMFPNTLLVVLGVLNEQCVGEHLCVPGYKTRVHMFPNNSLYPNSCFLHFCTLPIYRTLSVELCAPLPALLALGLFSFCHALPTAGLQRHKLPFGSCGAGQVGDGQEVLLSKEECPRRRGVRQDLKGLVALSVPCPWVSLLTTHPTTSSLQMNSKELHMSEVVQYNGSQRHPTNVRYVWYQPRPCLLPALSLPLLSFLCLTGEPRTSKASVLASMPIGWWSPRRGIRRRW